MKNVMKFGAMALCAIWLVSCGKTELKPEAKPAEVEKSEVTQAKTTTTLLMTNASVNNNSVTTGGLGAIFTITIDATSAYMINNPVRKDLIFHISNGSSSATAGIRPYWISSDKRTYKYRWPNGYFLPGIGLAVFVNTDLAPTHPGNGFYSNIITVFP